MADETAPWDRPPGGTQPQETAPWEHPERSVGRRMLDAAVDTFTSGLESGKKFFSEPSNIGRLVRPETLVLPALPEKLPENWEETKEMAKGMGHEMLERAKGVMAPATMTVGAAGSGLLASPAASAL